MVIKKRKLFLIFGIIYILGACNIDRNVESMEDEFYDYEVIEKDEKIFSVYSSENHTYNIPYVQIDGCPDEYLEWKINHTLWEGACWIFEEDDFGDQLYELFSCTNESHIEIAEVYKCGRYLSVVYQSSAYISDLERNITYAVVVDIMTGERILLSDLIKKEDALKTLIEQTGETYYKENIDRANEIFLYGGMTEAETIIYNAVLENEYPIGENEVLNDVNCFFNAVSFYVTEDNCVIILGVDDYRQISLGWEELEDIVKMPYDLGEE